MGLLSETASPISNIPDWENMEDENEFDITTNGDGEILRSPNIS